MAHALIVDTETSGLFDYTKGAHEPGQPYMASIAAKLLDGGGAQVAAMHRLIKPTEEWGERAIAEAKEGLGAFKINNLSYDQLMAEGVPVKQALAEYDDLTNACDGIAAFNVSYDQKVIRGAYRRASMPDRYGERPTYCVMRGSGELLKLEGIKLGKVPNLREAVEYLLGKDHLNAHNAEDDLNVTVDLYRLLLAKGLVAWKPQVSKLKE